MALSWCDGRTSLTHPLFFHRLRTYARSTSRVPHLACAWAACCVGRRPSHSPCLGSRIYIYSSPSGTTGERWASSSPWPSRRRRPPPPRRHRRGRVSERAAPVRPGPSFFDTKGRHLLPRRLHTSSFHHGSIRTLPSRRRADLPRPLRSRAAFQVRKPRAHGPGGLRPRGRHGGARYAACTQIQTQDLGIVVRECTTLSEAHFPAHLNVKSVGMALAQAYTAAT